MVEPTQYAVIYLILYQKKKKHTGNKEPSIYCDMMIFQRKHIQMFIWNKNEKIKQELWKFRKLRRIWIIW